ncbi:MAG: hypothetical protein IKN92_02640 [Clostridia bacterium]|nr:hypothetical protein [Clostridia bacterium]
MYYFRKAMILLLILVIVFVTGCQRHDSDIISSKHEISVSSPIKNESQEINPPDNGDAPYIIQFFSEEEFLMFLNLREDRTLIQKLPGLSCYQESFSEEDFLRFLEQIKCFTYPVVKEYDSVLYEYYVKTNHMFIDYVIDGIDYRFVLNIVDDSLQSIMEKDSSFKEITGSKADIAAEKEDSERVFILFEMNDITNRLFIFSNDRESSIDWFRSLSYIRYK